MNSSAKVFMMAMAKMVPVTEKSGVTVHKKAYGNRAQTLQNKLMVIRR